MKKCSTCQKIKGISEFPKRVIASDGLNSYCKTCRYEYQLDWKKRHPDYIIEYREKNRDKLKAQNRKRYVAKLIKRLETAGNV